MDVQQLVALAIFGGVVGWTTSVLLGDNHPKTAAVLVVSYLVFLFVII